MIDPFHLEAYGKTAVNYNRDVEIFPVLNAIFEKIYEKSPYQSPTDMGVNMAGNCISSMNSSFMFMIELRKTRRHFPAARTGSSDNH